MTELHISALGGLALAAALAVSLAASAQTGSPQRGHDLVVRNCGMCHAVGRSDVSASPSAPAFRDLNQRYPVDNLAEALAEGILTGHPQMPEFSFNAAQVADIIAYLQSIQTQQPAASEPPGSPARRAVPR
jgi:cytochrome c